MKRYMEIARRIVFVFFNIHNLILDNNLVNKCQSGVLPGHSTTFQLKDIYHLIYQAIDTIQVSGIVFCDVSKDFDIV